MATMQLTTTMANGAVVTNIASVADQHAVDIVTWVISTYPQQNDDAGNPLIRDAAWAIKAWFEGSIAETVAKVHAWKQNNAASQAASAVLPIEVSVQ